jgi:hypothetical protein
MRKQNLNIKYRKKYKKNDYEYGVITNCVYGLVRKEKTHALVARTRAN